MTTATALPPYNFAPATNDDMPFIRDAVARLRLARRRRGGRRRIAPRPRGRGARRAPALGGAKATPPHPRAGLRRRGRRGAGPRLGRADRAGAGAALPPGRGLRDDRPARVLRAARLPAE